MAANKLQKIGNWGSKLHNQRMIVLSLDTHPIGIARLSPMKFFCTGDNI